MMFLIGVVVGVLIGVITMCLLFIGNEPTPPHFITFPTEDRIPIRRIEAEIESAEHTIQSIKRFNDIGGTLNWWQGRKSLAEQLLSEVKDRADFQSTNRT